MPKFAIVLLFIAMTFLSWGIYGPVLHEGQHDMGVPLQPSSLRPFICVGIAYFVIAVVVPIVFLKVKGEKGNWTLSGFMWSFAAGAAGAVGALGIILAFKSRGSPVYVMPLVFGLAPVVNTFVTMFMARTFKEASGLFFAGVTVVAIGAAGVLFFKPTSKNVEVLEDKAGGKVAVVLTETSGGSKKTERWPDNGFLTPAELKDHSDKAYMLYLKKQPLKASQMMMIALSIGLTALCWGSYGPVLHKGQSKMAGSRLRPFLCVGLAYFAIAVVVPYLVLNSAGEPGGWNGGGVFWSLLAGGAGAVGALGIILAFNFGGKPIFVMPLVFGGAPVVNTFATVVSEGTIGQLSTAFAASLALVIGGAVAVLVFAPRPGKQPDDSKPAPDDLKSKPNEKTAPEREPFEQTPSKVADEFADSNPEPEEAAAEPKP